jgi:DNA-directed RNA polymerase subunit H
MSDRLELRIENIIRGVKAILARREYKIVKEERFEKKLDLVCEKKDDPKQKLYGRISFEDKVGVALLRKYVEKLKEEYDENTQGLLVALNRFTHYARRESKEDDIWIITSKDPRFDIFQHELVPEHIICPEDELQELLEKYRIDKTQLPKIFVSDTAVKAIGAKPGQVVKIFRESPVTGRAIAYRLVIENPPG